MSQVDTLTVDQGEKRMAYGIGHHASQGNTPGTYASTKTTNFRTMSRILDILKGGQMLSGPRLLCFWMVISMYLWNSALV